ncbi:MAG: hypothetical protein NXI22_20275, partial [bacterium]|nr:hypothetical protein [bacterium]
RLQGVAKNNYVAPFNLKSGGHGFRDYDNQYVISGADLNQLLANTKKAAAALTEIKIEDGKPTRGSRSPQQLFSLIDPAQKEPATDEQLTTATVWLYNRVLLREPTANEKQRVIEFARRSMQSDGRLLGVRNMISAVLLNPSRFIAAKLAVANPTNSAGSCSPHVKLPIQFPTRLPTPAPTANYSKPLTPATYLHVKK